MNSVSIEVHIHLQISQICMPTCIHTYLHTYMHTYIHDISFCTYIHPYTHTCMSAHMHKSMHACMHTATCIHTAHPDICAHLLYLYMLHSPCGHLTCELRVAVADVHHKQTMISSELGYSAPRAMHVLRRWCRL